MASLRALVPAALVLAFSIGALPLTASADTGRDAASAGKLVGEKGHGKHAKHFPMKAEQFKKVLDKRIEHARARLDKVLDDRKVPDAIKTQVRKDFADGAAAVRALADKAEADGVVTKEEAKQVRELAQQLKRQAKDKYGMGHGKKAQRDHRAHRAAK
jgi:hypothetical protein